MTVEEEIKTFFENFLKILFTIFSEHSLDDLPPLNTCVEATFNILQTGKMFENSFNGFHRKTIHFEIFVNVLVFNFSLYLTSGCWSLAVPLQLLHLAQYQQIANIILEITEPLT